MKYYISIIENKKNGTQMTRMQATRIYADDTDTNDEDGTLILRPPHAAGQAGSIQVTLI